MKNRFLSLLILILLGSAQAHAVGDLTSPTVDLENRLVGQDVSMAIWTTVRSTQARNTEISIVFPSGFDLYGLNPGTCQCLFVKATDANGTFSPTEVTVTAGHVMGRTLEVHLPIGAYPGPMYLRIDPSAGLRNPSEPGTRTLVIEDAHANRVASHSFRIMAAATADLDHGTIQGTVLDAAGKAVAGAIVVASSDASVSIEDLELGPGRSDIEPMDGSHEMLMAISGQDGSFSLEAPADSTGSVYYLQANFTVRTDQALLTYKTGTAEVAVNPTENVTQNLPQGALVTSTPLD